MKQKETPSNYGRRRNDYPGPEVDQKSVIRQVFESEAGRYAAIAVFFIPMVTFIWNIKSDQQQIRSDITLIQQNHFTHIEQLTKEQTEMRETQIELSKAVVELQKQSVVILERLTK